MSPGTCYIIDVTSFPLGVKTLGKSLRKRVGICRLGGLSLRKEKHDR